MIVEQLAQLETPLGDLHLLPGNPRQGDVDAVARSLDRFGQRKPIVVTSDGTIIAGNHTYQAAVQLGWSTIAAVRVDDDEMTARAFALADNRTSDLGTYDDELLAAMLSQLADDDPSWLAAVSYTDEDLAKLLDDGMNGDAAAMLGAIEYRIVIDCIDEAHQRRLLDQLERLDIAAQPQAF